MTPRFQFSLVRSGIAFAMCCSGLVLTAVSQETFSEAEAQLALKAALSQNKQLQGDLLIQKQATETASSKAAVLSKDAAALREENEQLRLKLEALGAIAGNGDLEAKLLDALSDLKVERASSFELKGLTHELSESISAYINGDEEQKSQLRSKLEGTLARARAIDNPLSDSVTENVRIETSQIVSVKPEENLIVVNAGKQTGVKIGTPLRIYRNDRPTASAVIVEVRSKLAGGLITKIEGNEFPRVGDTLRIDTRIQN